MPRQRVRGIAFLAALCLWLSPALGTQSRAGEELFYEPAEKFALIIENRSYESSSFRHLEGTGGALEQLSRVLSDQFGFNVDFLANATTRRIQKSLRILAERLGPRGSLLIVYYGRCESEGGHAYWLGVEADLDYLKLGSIPTSSISRMLKSIDTRDVLLMTPNDCYSGTADPPWPEDAESTIAEALVRREPSRRIILMGPGTAEARLGVPFIREFTARLSEATEILSADRVFLDVVERLRAENPAAAEEVSLQAITLAGHDRGHFLFVPRDLEGEASGLAASEEPDPGRMQELLFWTAIKDETEPQFFEAYLEAFPQGVFASLARLRMEQLQTAEDPRSAAPIDFPPSPPRIERVQMALTFLGYDPGPIDGVWGPRTGDAVRAWQGAEGEDVTGRLTREQYARLELESVPEPASGGPDLEVGQVFRDCAVCPEMTVVGPGRYLRLVGIPRGTILTKKADLPTGTASPVVVVRSPFAVGRFEVTFDDWDACVEAGGCNGYTPDDEGWGRGRRPVIDISYDDAQAYVEWISRETGHSYRLPSENEWDYVARAGSVTRYWWGESASPDMANYGGKVSRSREVGSYPPNPFGLHDTQGNVWELVEDCWDPDYDAGPRDQGVRGVSFCRRVVIRGGSWYDDGREIRSSSRSGIRIDSRINNVGFRIARHIVQRGFFVPRLEIRD